MNRIIKFRVWNGEAMISPDYVDRNGLAWWKENSIPETSKEIMQFTGLTDKNGVEIYEGDVLKDVFGTGNLQIVIYDEDRFIVKGTGIRVSSFAAPRQIEVIGNIHQHPDLLTALESSQSK